MEVLELKEFVGYINVLSSLFFKSNKMRFVLWYLLKYGEVFGKGRKFISGVLLINENSFC